MKKGVAVFYDPHNIYQFLWYYSTYGKNTEWQALCLPTSFMGDQVSDFCHKLGIFKQIIKSPELYESWNLKKQFKEFIKMLGYALIGKQKKYANKFIYNIIGNLEYDEAVVLTDCGYVAAMFIVLSAEKDVIILEDGMGDYIDRKYSNIFHNITNLYSIKGFILSVAGYVNFSSRYPLRTTKNCIKFCSHPEKMKYKNYKTILPLFDLSKTDSNLFKQKLELIYMNLPSYFEKNPQLILFTTPLIDYTDTPVFYYKRVEKYINERKDLKKIIIKKHPRDRHLYKFRNEIQVIEIPQSIPAEVLLPYLKNIDIYFMELSSTNLYMTGFNYSPMFFYHTKLESEQATKGCADMYYPKKEFIKRLNYWGIHEKQIIDL